MNILIINSGSSSIKYACMQPTQAEPIFEGQVAGINTEHSAIAIKYKGNKHEESKKIQSHVEGIEAILNLIQASDFDITSIDAIGHRVVHGGSTLTETCEITDEVISKIEANRKLAPLHNPANLSGIEACQKQFPALPQFAIFDTAFHQTLPEVAYQYPLNMELIGKHGIRKYGFHGISHEYITEATANYFNKIKSDINLISCHLGNGASITAIKDGKSVETSMGLTPLAGLMMGTRSGDIDPGLFAFLAKAENLTVEQIDELLNKQSGLKGISLLSSDMRTIEEACEKGDKQAMLAIDMFCYRVAKTISSFLFLSQSLDAIVFTGGIGENSPVVREKVIALLESFNFKLNLDANQKGMAHISEESSQNILVLRTNEELQIAKHVAKLLEELA